MRVARSAPRTLLVVILLATAGCQGLNGSSAAPSDERAVEAVDRAQAEALNVSSYRFAVDGQVRIRDDSRTESVEIAGHGIVDVDRQRSNLTVGIEGATPIGQRGTRTAYLDGYTLDVECSRMGWARYNLSTDTRWFNYTPLGQQFELLDRTNVYWNGTETVDGVETAVVTAHPTEQQLQAADNLPTGSVGTTGGPNFENATVRVWIDTATDRVRKVQREIHVSADDSTAEATVTFRFSAYDEPTDITRPSFEEASFQWDSDCPDT